MGEREVNPVESRHRELSAQFKAAWAFHQLLVGMDRMGAVKHFQNRSNEFQSLFSKLRELSDSSHDPTAGRQDLDPRLLRLEVEIMELRQQLERTDEGISPSALRLFFQQIRSLDERILIEIVRFYIEIQKGRKWRKDRLDKADYILSRLAELIAGPGLKGDRSRLNKVLAGISSVQNSDPLDDAEIEHIRQALADQRPEVRWIKTFEELNESGRIELYRALKHELGPRIFHPTILPLVVEVNSSFRTRIDELRDHAENRLVEEFRRLSELRKKGGEPTEDVTVELDRLQERVEEFRARVKESNIRLTELVDLSRDLDDLAERYEAHFNQPPEPEPTPESTQSTPPAESEVVAEHAFAAEIEVLQPHWSELFSELSSLAPSVTPEDAVTAAALARYRLEAREVVAFRRLVGEQEVDKVVEQFILAAAVLRWRMLQEVVDIREIIQSQSGAVPKAVVQKARQTCRHGDAYLKLFSHWVDQAVFDGDFEAASSFQALQLRLQRDLSGLMILVHRLSKSPL